MLTEDQRTCLRVLGYLFLRMGLYERAQRLFTAMIVLDPNDRWAHRNLAVTALALGDHKMALEHIRLAIGDGVLSTADSALYLLKAQALWRSGRQDEAKRAIDAYIATSGTINSNIQSEKSRP